MNSRQKVTKLKTNVCEICGTTYTMYKYDVFGHIAGVRTKYCSDECSRKAKIERDKNSAQVRVSKSELAGKKKPGPKPYPNPNRQYNNMFKVGPMETQTCLGCPFQGWECREMKHPICRPHHKMHHEYKRVLRECEDRYYWS